MQTRMKCEKPKTPEQDYQDRQFKRKYISEITKNRPKRGHAEFELTQCGLAKSQLWASITEVMQAAYDATNSKGEC